MAIRDRRNEFLQWTRKRAREAPSIPTGGSAVGRESEPSVDEIPDGFDLEVELERDELARLLDRAMALLPETTRQILVARFVHDSPLVEIAEGLGLREGSVAVRLHRGKLALRRILTTTLAGEAAAYGLAEPIEDSWQGPPNYARWQETRIWCPSCGGRHLVGLLNAPAGIFRVHCLGCGIQPSNTWWNGLFDDVRGYRAALRRFLDAVDQAYTQGVSERVVSCPHCRRALPVLLHHPSHPDWRRGIFYQCSPCERGAFNGHLANVLALPAVRRFWREHPRIRLVPERSIDVGGSSATVTGFAAVGEIAHLDVVVARDTYNVIGISGAPPS